MPEIGSYKNVFDDQNEFNKLNDLILAAIQDFSNYRKGNLTYGEIMFVLECVLDSLRGASEKDAQAGSKIKGLNEGAHVFHSVDHHFQACRGSREEGSCERGRRGLHPSWRTK